MDWEGLTPVQLLAVGAVTAECRKRTSWSADGCGGCPIKKVCESSTPTEEWAIEHPEEAIRTCGVKNVEFEETICVQTALDGDKGGQGQARIKELEGLNRRLSDDLETTNRICTDLEVEVRAYKKALKWALKHMGA